jgi:hypothetical protein
MEFCTFGFDAVAVVIGDLYLLDPGETHGAERGVRLEIRLIERELSQDALFAAAPVTLGRPLWRADLLEAVDHPGTLDRAHHHTEFADWEPSEREFTDMAGDPVGWVTARLGNLDGVLGPAGPRAAADADRVRQAVPEVRAAIERLLGGIRARPLTAFPAAGPARVGWF